MTGNRISTPGPFGKPVALVLPAVCTGKRQALPSSRATPVRTCPVLLQTPVVSLPACLDARKDCCLPLHPIRRLSLPSDREIIPIDHNYTYFGAQCRGLHACYTRLHAPRYRNTRGFATDLPAQLWSGRTCLAATTPGAPTGLHQRVSETSFLEAIPSFRAYLGARIALLAKGIEWRWPGPS